MNQGRSRLFENISMRVRFALLLLGYIVLHGCTALPNHAVVQDMRYSQWSHNRHELMQKFPVWQWEGRALIQDNGKVQRVNIAWHTQSDALRIELSGPFGMGGATVEMNPQGAFLKVGDQVLRAQTVQHLVTRYMAWPVPVLQMQKWYWGLGTSMKGAEFDEVGQLKHLTDGGWELEYSDYRKVKGILFPYKLRARNGQTLVKLKISQWQLL